MTNPNLNHNQGSDRGRWGSLVDPGPEVQRVGVGEGVARRSLAVRGLPPAARELPSGIATLACPLCGVRLTVRLFLPGAGCWHCGADLELCATGVVAEGVTRPGSLDPVPAAAMWQVPRPPALPGVLGEGAGRAAWEQIPAGLVSGLLHVALFLGLALFQLRTTSPAGWDLVVQLERFSPARGLATEVLPLEFVSPVPLPGDPMPAPPTSRPDDRQAVSPALPLSTLQRTLRDPASEQRLWATRDLRVRQAVLQSEGGSPQTEQAVRHGLRWLAQHQMPDGRWSLREFHRADACQGLCGGQGQTASDSAATSLALLAFLGAGETPRQGEYGAAVEQGLRWLVAQQSANGDLRGDSSNESGSYAHGQGAIVLCEAYALTGDPSLRYPAQQALDHIVATQDSGGGWRYVVGEPGDTSVLGWQVMALRSGQSAGLMVPDQVWDGIDRFLATVAYQQDSLYAYQPLHFPTATMTAEALLCRVFLGWGLEQSGLQDGVAWLLQNHHPAQTHFDIYYLYYGTQLMHQVGGADWDAWNRAMRPVLLERQVQEGHEAGSWAPAGPHAHQGGRVYVTSLAVCCLEVYYRHAPIFRPLQLP